MSELGDVRVMRERHLHELANVLVVERVVDGAAFAAVAHGALGSQYPQVLRGGGLAQASGRRQRTDGELLDREERQDHPQSGGLTEHLQAMGDLAHGLVVGERGTRTGDRVGGERRLVRELGGH